jgi:hypothetical protein
VFKEKLRNEAKMLYFLTFIRQHQPFWHFSHKSAYPFRILPQDFDWVHPLFIFLIKEGAQIETAPRGSWRKDEGESARGASLCRLHW